MIRRQSTLSWLLPRCSSLLFFSGTASSSPTSSATDFTLSRIRHHSSIRSFSSQFVSTHQNPSSGYDRNSSSSILSESDWDVLIEKLHHACSMQSIPQCTEILSRLEDEFSAIFDAHHHHHHRQQGEADSDDVLLLPLCPLKPRQVAAIMWPLSFILYVRLSYRCLWALTWCLCCTADGMTAQQATLVMEVLRVRRDVFHAGVAATLCEQVIYPSIEQQQQQQPRKSSGQQQGDDVQSPSPSPSPSSTMFDADAQKSRRALELQSVLMFIATFSLHRRNFLAPETMLAAVTELARLAESDSIATPAAAGNNKSNNNVVAIDVSTKFLLHQITLSELPHAPLVVPMQRAILRHIPTASLHALNSHLIYVDSHPEVRAVGSALIPAIVTEALERFAFFFSVDEDERQDQQRRQSAGTALTSAALREGQDVLKLTRQIIKQFLKNSNESSSSSSSPSASLPSADTSADTAAAAVAANAKGRQRKYEELVSTWKIARNMFETWIAHRAWEILARTAAAATVADSQTTSSSSSSLMHGVPAEIVDKVRSELAIHLQSGGNSREKKRNSATAKTEEGASDSLELRQEPSSSSKAPAFLNPFLSCPLCEFTVRDLGRIAIACRNSGRSDGNAAAAAATPDATAVESEHQRRITVSLFFLTALIMLKTPRNPSSSVEFRAMEHMVQKDFLPHLRVPLRQRMVLVPRMPGTEQPHKWLLLSCQAAENMGVRCREMQNIDRNDEDEQHNFTGAAANAMFVFVRSLRLLSRDSRRRVHIVVDRRHGSVDFLFRDFNEAFLDALPAAGKGGSSDDSSVLGPTEKEAEGRVDSFACRQRRKARGAQDPAMVAAHSPADEREQ